MRTPIAENKGQINFVHCILGFVHQVSSGRQDLALFSERHGKVK